MSDVSYRALSQIAVTARRHALDVQSLIEGTSLTLGDFGRRRGYFPWSDFRQLLLRLEAVLGEQAMARTGAYSLEVARDLGPRLDVLGSAVDPSSLYVVLHKIVGPVVYPLFRSSLERRGERALVFTLELPQDRAGCAAYFRACIGAFEALPTSIGLGESLVEAEVSDHHGWYLITLPPRASLRRRIKRSLTSLFRPGDLFEELEAQTLEMQTWHRELNEARERAEEASRHKSAFVATMSHEIRTPVSAIVGVTELLLRDELSVDQRERVETVHTAARYLASVVNGVLDLAKVESGRMESRTSAVDVVALTEDVCRLFGPASTAKGLSLTAAVDDDVPRFASIDGVRVSQVLVNLVGNAVKFTDRGSVTLRVQLPAEGQLRFVVQDTGPGFAEEDRPRLFEPFVRGSRPSLDGTGLGLAIARGLAAALGATLELETPPEGGASFSFTLPAPAAAPVVKTPTPELSAAVRTLLVEDDAVSRKVGALLLQRLGAEVDVAVDGRDALARLSTTAYDLVLMDCHMPYLDGWEATRTLRSSDLPSKSALVVALTACGTVKDQDASFAAGMDGYLDKPVDIDALQQWLAKAAQGALKEPAEGTPDSAPPASPRRGSGPPRR